MHLVLINLGKEICASLDDGYFVLPKVVSLLTAVVSMVQIIFFSETVVVIMSTKIPSSYRIINKL
ncbi:hypothetical protein [uncultured Cetobacterium sp.]|uniref:hypothetical protein n=1 Tax=uncultured Cetobacterium sp. TaxID=527638 RepID=UPI00260D73CE|nr:hypothetical protein [uncultured Cetobacterium sp.]